MTGISPTGALDSPSTYGSVDELRSALRLSMNQLLLVQVRAAAPLSAMFAQATIFFGILVPGYEGELPDPLNPTKGGLCADEEGPE